MNDICLPVRYDQLTEQHIQTHLRYCASKLGNGDRVEILFGEAGAVIPVVKRIPQKKPAMLEFLVRSGSVGRKELAQLRNRLLVEGFTSKSLSTPKKKLLRRLVVPITVDDVLLPLKGLGVLRAIATELSAPWPGTIVVAYAIGAEGPDLPGRLTIPDSFSRSGYQLGYQLGKVIGRVVRKVVP